MKSIRLRICIQVGLVIVGVAIASPLRAEVKVGTKLFRHHILRTVADRQLSKGPSPISELFDELEANGAPVRHERINTGGYASWNRFTIDLAEGVFLERNDDLITITHLGVELSDLFDSVGVQSGGASRGDTAIIQGRAARALKQALLLIGRRPDRRVLSLNGTPTSPRWVGILPGESDIVCSTQEDLCGIANN